LELLILFQYFPAVPLVWYKSLTGMLIITQLVMVSVFLWTTCHGICVFMDPVLNQMNPVHIFMHCFSGIYFTTLLMPSHFSSHRLPYPRLVAY
jgi:hypothetical protein